MPASQPVVNANVGCARSLSVDILPWRRQSTRRLIAESQTGISREEFPGLGAGIAAAAANAFAEAELTPSTVITRHRQLQASHMLKIEI